MADNTNFWTNAPAADPKRGFRFRVSMGNLGMLWMAKKADRPTLSITNEAGATLESWYLHNAWMKEVDFSELDYSNDDLSEVTVKLRYDWAEFTGGGKQLFRL